MTIPRGVSLPLVGLLAALVLAAIVWLTTGGYEDFRRGRAIVALIKGQAAREQVVAQLQVPFIDYSVGATSRPEFERWLTLAHDACRTGVRERAARYPGVLYHTTAWTMTWLFFDENSKLRSQFKCSQ
jgi:hypothetical protein